MMQELWCKDMGAHHLYPRHVHARPELSKVTALFRLWAATLASVESVHALMPGYGSLP